MVRVSMLGLLVLALAGPATAAPNLPRWEHGAAQIQISRVRMLVQRLSKQNVLYQFQIGDARKRDLIETVEEIDAALAVLEEGDAVLAVPEPPTSRVRKRIAELDDAWGSLRMIAAASPTDYARRVGIGSKSGTGDPLRIRTFESEVDRMDAEAQALSDAYLALCGDPDADCRAVARATNLGNLSERMLKEAVLVKIGLDATAHAKELRETRAAFASSLRFAAEQQIVQAAMSPERGRTGEIMRSIWSDIGTKWERIRGDVDVVIAGGTGQVDLVETLRVQRELSSEMLRFQVAVRRFATAQREAAART